MLPLLLGAAAAAASAARRQQLFLQSFARGRRLAARRRPAQSERPLLENGAEPSCAHAEGLRFSQPQTTARRKLHTRSCANLQRAAAALQKGLRHAERIAPASDRSLLKNDKNGVFNAANIDYIHFIHFDALFLIPNDHKPVRKYIQCS